MTATEKYNEAYETAKNAWSALQIARQEEETAYQEHKTAEEKYGVVSDQEIEAWTKLAEATSRRNKAQEAYDQAHQAEHEASLAKDEEEEKEYQVGKLYETISNLDSHLDEARQRESIAHQAHDEALDTYGVGTAEEDKAYRYYYECKEETAGAESDLRQAYRNIESLLATPDQESDKRLNKLEELRKIAYELAMEALPGEAGWLLDIARETNERGESYFWTKEAEEKKAIADRAYADQKRYGAEADEATEQKDQETAIRLARRAWGAYLVGQEATREADEASNQARYRHDKALAVRNK